MITIEKGMEVNEMEISTINDKKICDVKLDAISDEININPRRGLNMDNVDKLVASEGMFPEIHLGLFDGKIIIVDGYHRFAAARALELESIKAYITEYNSMEALETDAFNENVNHGERLSEYDIANWIYNMYVKAIKLAPTTSLVSFIKKCKIDPRRARSLFNWVLFHKEILEDDEVTIKQTGTIDELYSLVIHLQEIPGSVTEESKIILKQFYNKYASLSRNDLREAIKYFKEGKDFDEVLVERKKQQEADEAYMDSLEAKDKKEYFDQFEKIDSEDVIDRNGIADYSNREYPEIQSEANDIIEDLAEQDKINEEIKESVKTEKSVTPYIEKASTVIMSLSMLKNNKSYKWTYDDFKSISVLIDSLSGILEEIDPTTLEGYENAI